jgi:hypothetical protein
LHPISVIEITVLIVIVIIFFIISLIVPNKLRKIGLIIASSLTVFLLSFFAIRPYLIDYQVSIKKELLNEYLVDKYPNEEWEINRQIGRQYNPFHLEVRFENEREWTYTYSVVNEKRICQNVWSPPEGEFPDEGKHYERNNCE